MLTDYIYIKDGCLDDFILKQLFAFHENNINKIYKGTTQTGVNTNIKDTEDLIFLYNNNNNNNEKNIITIIENILYKELKEYVKKHPVYKEYENLCLLDLILMQKYTKNTGKYVYHTDNCVDIDESVINKTKMLSDEIRFIGENNKRNIKHRILTFIFYLNDVDEGGETEFFEMYRVRPKKGSLLIFPALSYYLHRGCVPKSNDKYILTGWLYSL